MHSVSEMVRTNPSILGDDAELIRCIETCLIAAQACVACGDSCLSEADVKALARCIRLTQDCADVIQTTGRMVSRQKAADPQLLGGQLDLCAMACSLCAFECERHGAQHEHCRVCADACRWCEIACRELRAKLPAKQTQH
jgi:hypothetical protein